MNSKITASAPRGLMPRQAQTDGACGTATECANKPSLCPVEVQLADLADQAITVLRRTGSVWGFIVGEEPAPAPDYATEGGLQERLERLDDCLASVRLLLDRIDAALVGK